MRRFGWQRGGFPSCCLGAKDKFLSLPANSSHQGVPANPHERSQTPPDYHTSSQGFFLCHLTLPVSRSTNLFRAPHRDQHQPRVASATQCLTRFHTLWLPGSPPFFFFFLFPDVVDRRGLHARLTRYSLSLRPPPSLPTNHLVSSDCLFFFFLGAGSQKQNAQTELPRTRRLPAALLFG